MAKILILGNSSSGLYGFRNELVVNLLKKHDVYVSLPDDTNNKELEEEGCTVIHTSINRRGMDPVQDFSLFLSYCKLLKQVKPDVVLSYTIKPNVYGGMACALKRIPYIANITGLGSALKNGGMVQKLAVMLYRTGLKKVKCVFFQNQYNLQYFEQYHITNAKKVLIPGSGVNLEQHKKLSYPKHDIPEFLFVGRVMKEKGIEEYLHAAEVYQNCAKFGIIGYYEEEYEERIKALEEKGTIKFHGYQSDVDSFYHSCDSVIVPSYHEGMSNVLLEAAACGRPVLATDINGCKEGIEDGVTGILFAPKQKESLLYAVKLFLEMSVEEREQMGQRAREKMEKEFSRTLVVQAYMKEIETILKMK